MVVRLCVFNWTCDALAICNTMRTDKHQQQTMLFNKRFQAV